MTFNGTANILAIRPTTTPNYEYSALSIGSTKSISLASSVTIFININLSGINSIKLTRSHAFTSSKSVIVYSDNTTDYNSLPYDGSAINVTNIEQYTNYIQNTGSANTITIEVLS